MSTEPLASVIIPAYNAATTIGDQLEALVAQEGAPPFEVIVANNRSTDDTVSVAEKFRDRLNLRVIPAFERQGVNCARNAGIAAARGSIIVLLDADDRARAAVVRSLCDALENDTNLGIAGGILSTRDPRTYEMERPQHHLPYAPGGIMAFRREVFTTIGGFDESFIGGHDEVDFCWRAQQAGFGITLARNALLDRVERPTRGRAFHQFRRYGFTYIQLWVKHREQKIPGGSMRSELRPLRNLLTTVLRLQTGGPEERLNAARALGWTLGRWQGNLHFRVWGPR